MYSYQLSSVLLFILVLLCFGCNSDSNSIGNDSKTEVSLEFKVLSSKETGVSFSNNITEAEDKNYFDFEYIYNGGGVALGDINNDGLVDIYLTGNEVSNKLYLNKGDMK